MVTIQQQQRFGRPGQVTTSLSIGRRSKIQAMQFAKARRRELTRSQIRELITRTWDEDLEVLLYLKDR